VRSDFSAGRRCLRRVRFARCSREVWSRPAGRACAFTRAQIDAVGGAQRCGSAAWILRPRRRRGGSACRAGSSDCPAARPTCGKNHCRRRRADLFTLPLSLRTSAALDRGGSYRAKSLRPGFHRARSPGRRRSCRNGCDRSCRGELRRLWWSLRKRLSPSLRPCPACHRGVLGREVKPDPSHHSASRFSARESAVLASFATIDAHPMYLAPAC
jgi:hypothetical protein